MNLPLMCCCLTIFFSLEKVPLKILGGTNSVIQEQDFIYTQTDFFMVFLMMTTVTAAGCAGTPAAARLENLFMNVRFSESYLRSGSRTKTMPTTNRPMVSE